MPEELFPRLFVRWSGYLNGDQGYHIIYITHRDGIRVWINEILVFEKWICVEEDQKTRIPFAMPSSGYVRFQLEYFSHGGPFGIEVEFEYCESMNHGNMTVQHSSNKLSQNAITYSFVPSDALMYDIPQIRLYQNVPLSPKSPILFGPISPTSYTIFPSLPKGLEIGNGILFGTPTEYTLQREYTITANSVRNPVTTRLLLDVQIMSVPQSLWLENPCGNNVTRLTVRQYELIPTLSVHWIGRVSSFTIRPSLPKGLSFNQINLTIEGRPSIQIPPTEYEVTAFNDIGMTRCQLTLEVIGCEKGPLVYSWLAGGQGLAQVTENDTILYTGFVNSGMYEMVLCLSPSKYTFSFNCTQGSICDLALIREDGLRLLYGPYLYGHEQTTSLDLSIQSPPRILLNRTVFYTLPNCPIEIAFPIEGAFFPVEFSPLLPPSVQFDHERLQLRGRFPFQGTFVYSVKTHNPVGTCEVTIEVYVGKCPPESTMYLFKRQFSLKGEQIMILQDNQLLYSAVCRGGVFVDLFCLSAGQYTVRLLSVNDRGWVANSDLVIRDCSERYIASYSVPPTLKQVEYDLSLELELTEHSSLLFLVTTLIPPSSWTLPSFNDTDWKIGKRDSWGIIPAGIATVYFRRELPLRQCVSPHYIRIAALLKEGIIIYVDGTESFRVNMPEGPVYHSTLATAMYEKPQWVDELVPIHSSHPLIAVELHRVNVVESTTVVFDLEVLCVLSDEIFRSDSQVRGSNHTVIPQHDALAVVDGDGSSSWMDSLFPVWVEVSLPTEHVMNRVDLQIGEYWWWEVPQTIRVMGIRKDSSEVSLLTHSSTTIFEGPYARVSLSFSNSVPYPAYRLQVDSIIGGVSVQLAEVAFYREEPVYCESDDVWPQTPANQMALAVCVGKLIGGQKRLCRKVNGKAVWDSVDRSGCVSVTPAYGYVFIDMELHLTNCSLYLWNSQVQRVVMRTLEHECRIHEKIAVFFAAAANDALFGVKTYLRVNVENSERKRIWSCMNGLRTKLTETVYQHCPETFPEGIKISVDGEIILRENHLIAWIVASILCVLFFVVLCWRGFYYWWNHAHAVHLTKQGLLVLHVC